MTVIFIGKRIETVIFVGVWCRCNGMIATNHNIALIHHAAFVDLLVERRRIDFDDFDVATVRLAIFVFVGAIDAIFGVGKHIARQ